MSDLTKKINLVGRFATLSKTVDFEEFYSINVWVQKDEITLQGKINPYTTTVAKKLGVDLIYNNDCEMLKGSTEDGLLRIVLTV
jgi:hypothetical protein